jgi:putative membrane protein
MIRLPFVKASWAVLTRDLGRLWRTPKVWVIIVGVMFTPALYSWFNVAAFWDPYGNTEHIGVAVVNEDEGGASDLTGPLDVGQQLVGQLKDNDRLGWQFMDADRADESLKKGDVFATVTVPKTFTSDILSMFSGTYSQPTLTYQVNEKHSAISPKITDQGATTLDTTLNSTIKQMVARAVTNELRTAGGSLENGINGVRDDTANTFDETAQTMSRASDGMTRIQGSLDGARPGIASTQDALRSVDTALGQAGSALSQVQSIMTEVQKQVASFADAATTAYVDSTGALADAASSANAAVSSASGELERAGSGLDAASRDAQGFVDQSDRAIGQLQSLLDSPALAAGAAQPLRDALNGLQEQNTANHELIDRLGGVSGDASGAVDALSQASDALSQATGESRDRARGMQTSVGDALPALNSAINKVNATAGGFAGALDSTRSMVTQSIGLLDGVDSSLGKTSDLVGDVKGQLSDISGGLTTAKTDIMALAAAADGGAVDTVKNLDSVGISRFMATPAQVESHPVYPVEHYGSGMAALFTNLSLWIGSFMLMVIFRSEVDTAGIRRLTVGQAYRGRLLLLAMLAVGQGIIVSVGNLVIGVQTVNPFAFVGTAVLTGLAYLTIIYGLISAFGHVGRGIAVVLAFLQIPGASGMYPIEMTPGFFRGISPYLPFTYGIDALRETIGGFYGNHWWRDMGMLALMAVVALVLGILLRRGLSNINRQVNRQLDAGGLIISERVEIVGSSYRLTDVIHALRDRDEFREELDGRWKPVREHWSALLRAVVAVGVVGVVVIVVLARVLPEHKALLFGVLCLLILLAVAAVAALEYVRQSFVRAQELSELPADELESALTHSPRGQRYIRDDADDAADAAAADEEGGRE